MSYDPRLKECMARIEKICEEYDCGALVSLISETHGEHRQVSPKWSALREEVDEQGRVRIRLKCSKEEKRRAELTAHYIHSQRDVSALWFRFFDELVNATKDKWQTEHTPFHQFRPHRKDEN